MQEGSLFPFLFEGWALKNWCFWTVVLEKTLESPVDSRRSNHSIPKELNPEYSLEGLMLKLKLQYFGHLRQRANSMENTLMLGKIEGRRRRGQQKMRWLDSITNSMHMSFCKLQTILKDWEAWPAAVHWVAKCGTSLNDWTTTMSKSLLSMFSSKSFRVYGLTFRSLIHFEFIFVYGVIFVYRLPW